MDRVYGGFAGLQNPKVNTSLYEKRDDVNLKLYGTTDVHILTDDDIWITEDGIFEAQKVERIDYDVVIIPYGVKHIIPKQPLMDDETGELIGYEDGVYPIWINAKKIICPSTLVNIYGSTDSGLSVLNINITGDFVLNEGIQIINLFDNPNASSSSELGNITIPTTLESFTVAQYNHDIIIPNNVNEFNLWSLTKIFGNLYVYNPEFDFSGFEIGIGQNEAIGTIYGYAGSTAEAFAKENGYTFVNMGSDYSATLGDIESAVDHILELDNSLLGGGAL